MTQLREILGDKRGCKQSDFFLPVRQKPWDQIFQVFPNNNFIRVLAHTRIVWGLFSVAVVQLSGFAKNANILGNNASGRYSANSLLRRSLRRQDRLTFAGHLAVGIAGGKRVPCARRSKGGGAQGTAR